ncbi:MAG: hypothetical protein WC604_03780 [Candidatus Gracilibacteria bacterium]
MENYTRDFDELLGRRDAFSIVSRRMNNVLWRAQMGTCEIRESEIKEVVAYVRHRLLENVSGEAGGVGVPGRMEARMDPITLTGQLFRGRRFLILQNHGGQRRVVVVPLKNPDLEKFVAVYESRGNGGGIGGWHEIVSVMEFLELVMRRNGAYDDSKVVDI